MNDIDVDALALAVDERVLALPEGLDPARCFGVRLRDHGFVLVPFWSGVARELPYGLTPPDGCWAIALETAGWAAPLEDDPDAVRPSAHPQRRRMHHTALVYGDGIDVGVLRCGDGAPQVMRGAVGVVPDLMLACWARRRESRIGGALGGG
jgi:hypothetical protein